MLERIWFKVFMISRIDNLRFLAAVRNIYQSASCVCKLLPAGDSSQFAIGGTGLWQASSQYGNVVCGNRDIKQWLSVTTQCWGHQPLWRWGAGLQAELGTLGKEERRTTGERLGLGWEGGPGAGGEGFKWRDRQKLITGGSRGGRIKWVFPSAQSQGLQRGWLCSKLHRGLKLRWGATPSKGTDLLLLPPYVNRVLWSPQNILLASGVARVDFISDSSTQQHTELSPGHPHSTISSQP